MFLFASHFIYEFMLNIYFSDSYFAPVFMPHSAFKYTYIFISKPQKSCVSNIIHTGFVFKSVQSLLLLQKHLECVLNKLKETFPKGNRSKSENQTEHIVWFIHFLRAYENCGLHTRSISTYIYTLTHTYTFTHTHEVPSDY